MAHLQTIYRSLTIGIVVTVLSITLGACKSDKGDGGSPNAFRYNVTDGIGTLDPALSGQIASIWAGTQLYNGLVELDTALNVVPSVAKSWSVDSTGLVWTFTLRPDVYFHENAAFGGDKTRKVVASDVKYSFERVMNAKTKSTGLWVFRERILGASEYHKRSTNGNAGEVEGIKVLNDSMVSITLVKPFAPFLSILTMPYCWIVPREAVEKYGDDFFKNPVGTGPFMLSAWQPDIKMVFKRNPKYFKKDASGAQLPYLEEVAISFMRDSKTEFMEFEKGSLDMVTNIDPAFSPSVLSAEGNLQGKYKAYNLLKAPALSIEYYGILLDETLEAGKASPLSKNKLLRQALNYAVNREQLVRYILRGKGISATNGVLPPTMPGFSKDVRGYSYDPQKARQLLAQAGYPNGKGLPKLIVQLGNSQTTGQVAEAIQQQWKEIGVNLEIRQVDFPQHLDMVRNSKLMLWRTNWSGDYPDPENFLALFYSANHSPGGPNTTHIRNTRLDSLYTAALNPLLSPVQRYALYNGMEHIILDEAPWIFLYYNAIQRLVQPSVKGLTVDGSDRLVLETVRKEAGR